MLALLLIANALLSHGVVSAAGVFPECYSTKKLPSETSPCLNSFDVSNTPVTSRSEVTPDAGTTRICMPMSTTRKCDSTQSKCCTSDTTDSVSVYEVQFFTRFECILGPSGKPFKSFKWTLNDEPIKPIIDSKTPALKFRRKWWPTATLCVDIPTDTTSPCNSLPNLCNEAGCALTLVTTPFRQTPTAKKQGCKMSTAIEFTCTTPCTKGKCTAYNTCDNTGDDALPTGADCIATNGLVEPECATPCLNNGVCTAGNTCDCTGTGYAGTACEAPECGGGGVCAGGRTCCNGACRDYSKDEYNCGSCGNACPGTNVCNGNGVCVACPVGSTYIYGIADNQQIYEVDVTAQTTDAVYNARPDIGSGLANAFAYDTARNQFLFLSNSKHLQFWDRKSSIKEIATPAQLGLSSAVLPANAVYWDNAFWFVQNTVTGVTKQRLVKIELDYNAAGQPDFGKRVAYNIDIEDGAGNPVRVYDQFGDIAVDANGVMYFATSPFSGANNAQTGGFYKLDLGTLAPNGGGGTALMIKPPSRGNIGLQLSFSCDFKTLWAQDYNTCNWYTVDTATGDLTFQFQLPLVGSGQSTCLRDLGGAACTCTQ